MEWDLWQLGDFGGIMATWWFWWDYGDLVILVGLWQLGDFGGIMATWWFWWDYGNLVILVGLWQLGDFGGIMATWWFWWDYGDLVILVGLWRLGDFGGIMVTWWFWWDYGDLVIFRMFCWQKNQDTNVYGINLANIYIYIYPSIYNTFRYTCQNNSWMWGGGAQFSHCTLEHCDEPLYNISYEHSIIWALNEQQQYKYLLNLPKPTYKETSNQ